MTNEEINVIIKLSKLMVQELSGLEKFQWEEYITRRLQKFSDEKDNELRTVGLERDTEILRSRKAEKEISGLQKDIQIHIDLHGETSKGYLAKLEEVEALKAELRSRNEHGKENLELLKEIEMLKVDKKTISDSIFQLMGSAFCEKHQAEIKSLSLMDFVSIETSRGCNWCDKPDLGNKVDALIKKYDGALKQMEDENLGGI